MSQKFKYLQELERKGKSWISQWKFILNNLQLMKELAPTPRNITKIDNTWHEKLRFLDFFYSQELWLKPYISWDDYLIGPQKDKKSTFLNCSYQLDTSWSEKEIREKLPFFYQQTTGVQISTKTLARELQESLLPEEMLLFKLNGEDQGMLWNLKLMLHQDDIVIAGRLAENHIVVKDNLVPRRNFGIGFEEGYYFINDFNGRNGTWINGKRIMRTLLENNDVIQIGRSHFLVLKWQPN